MAAPDAFQEKLAKLKASFAEGLPARLAEIAAAQGAFVDSHGAGQAASLKTLVTQAHKLAGSAGSFGFPELGNASRELDIHGSELLKSGVPLDSGAVQRIAELVSRIMSSSPVAPPLAPKVTSAATEYTEGAAAVQSRPEIGRSFERGLLHHRILTYVPVLLTALGIGLAGVYADYLNEKRFTADQHLDVADKLTAIRNSLEGHINGNINLVKGLVAAISTEPNMSQERYAALAEPLLSGTWQLRNIAAAPDLVIRYMYPLEGNEGAVGLDLRAHPAQREAALRARDTGELILAGPVALVQGGEGFIGRIPVFVESGTGRGRSFWGLISAVIDSARLYEAAGLLDERLPIEIAIRGKDALGIKGALFHGRADVFDSNPVLTSVALPDGSWQLAAVPKGGWPRRADNAWTLRLSFLLGGTLVVFFVGLATKLFRERLESLDALRASENRLRDIAETSSDWFWETGPDGRFTFFSDGFAESTGHAPNQLLGKTREVFVVRFPGDEGMWERHRRTLAARLPFRDLRYRYRRADGALGWLAATGKPILSADGSFRGYRGAAQEISKQVAAEQALIEAREKATSADQAKSEFLSSMSHELRTPLNAILGFGQLLQYNPKEPLTETQANSVRYILKGGEHLLNLINEVLDLAKIEAGRATFSIENVSTKALFDEVRLLIEPIAEKAKVVLEMIPPEPDFAIRADYTRIKQALLNLLSNAVKYNFEGGRVAVRAVPSRSGVLRLSVADTGPGIPAEKLPGLFQPFNRLGVEATEIEGTGIGLALSKKLVETMGGAVGCESELGVGSTFWMDMPLAERPAVAAIKARLAGAEEKQRGGLPAIRGTILYVEDNPDNLKLMEIIFSRVEGVTLLSAHNAELGLSLAAERKPDAVIMDINLPGMNGFEALENLKINEATRAIPVIALSANATDRDIAMGEKAGFFRYLTKPVDLDQLLRCVQAAIEK